MRGRNDLHAHTIMRAKLMHGGTQTPPMRHALVRLIVCGRRQEPGHTSVVSGAAHHVHAHALTVIRVTLIRATHRIAVEHATIMGGNIPIRGALHAHAGRGRNIIHLRHAGAHILSIHVHYDTTGGYDSQCGTAYTLHNTSKS